MADGYGFGGEGDWKTAALVRAMKVMGDGLDGRHLVHGGLHLSSGAAAAIRCSARTCSKSARRSQRASPRSKFIRFRIGGKDDPVRLVFDAATGPALNASLIDLGNRFRLIVNEVTAVGPPKPAETAGRARRLGMQARLQDGLRGLDSGRRSASHGLQLQRDPARCSRISPRSRASRWSTIGAGNDALPKFKQDLRNNDVYYYLAQGFRA